MFVFVGPPNNHLELDDIKEIVLALTVKTVWTAESDLWVFSKPKLQQLGLTKKSCKKVFRLALQSLVDDETLEWDYSGTSYRRPSINILDALAKASR